MARPPIDPLMLYGLGLIREGNTVNLKPAKFDPLDLGGLYVLPATGIGITDDGGLAGIRATPDVQGMLLDAPYNGNSYIRKDGDWTEVTPTDPANLPIATYTNLGVVYIVPDRALRIEANGALDILPAAPDQLGVIFDPPFDSANPDVTYTRKWGNWVEQTTVPPVLTIEIIVPNTAQVGQSPLNVAVYGTKFTATTTIIVDGAAKATTYVSPTELIFQIDPSLETIRAAIITVQDTIGPVNGIGDAAFYFIANTNLYRGTYSPVNNTPDIWAARQLNQMWIVDLVDPMVPEFSGVPGLANIPLNEGDHLVYDGTQYNVVDGNQTQSLYQGWWKPATNVPDIGAMTKYTGYMWIADTAIPNTPETPPLGLPGLDGVAIYEGDMILWDGAKFVLMQGVLTPNYRGLWNVASNTPDIANPPIGNNKPNWMWIAKTVDPLVPEVAPATIPGIAGMSIREGDHIVWDKPNSVFMKVSGNGAGGDEPPADDKGYVRTTHLNGVSQWVPPALPPLATDLEPGLIFEPSPDDKQYVRSRSIAGVSTWVESVSAGGTTIADTAPPGAIHGDTWWESDTGKYYIYFDDGNSQQWVQISGGGGGTYNITGVGEAPVDTKQYARQDAAWTEIVAGGGGIGEAPNDGQAYARQSLNWSVVPPGTFVDAPADTKTYGRKDLAWTEIVVPPALPIVPVADTFPASPVQGQLHFLGTDASLYIWFIDASTVGSWVEVSAP